MLTILDNDLANLIHAERQMEAARERLANESVTSTTHASSPSWHAFLSAPRTAAIALRAWFAGRIRPVASRSEPA